MKHRNEDNFREYGMRRRRQAEIAAKMEEGGDAVAKTRRGRGRFAANAFSGKALPHTVVMLEVQEPCTLKRRLVSMDIDDVEDWGDIKMTKNGDGEVSGEVVTYGDDAWAILNAYRVVPLGDGKHNGKFPMSEAIELGELYEMLLERFEEFQG